MRLERRKYYLHRVIETLNKHGVCSVVEVPYFKCGNHNDIVIDRPAELLKKIKGFDKKYPTLHKDITKSKSPLKCSCHLEVIMSIL